MGSAGGGGVVLTSKKTASLRVHPEKGRLVTKNTAKKSQHVVVDSAKKQIRRRSTAGEDAAKILRKFF